jgi:hypothetical protein
MHGRETQIRRWFIYPRCVWCQNLQFTLGRSVSQRPNWSPYQLPRPISVMFSQFLQVAGADLRKTSDFTTNFERYRFDTVKYPNYRTISEWWSYFHVPGYASSRSIRCGKLLMYVDIGNSRWAHLFSSSQEHSLLKYVGKFTVSWLCDDYIAAGTFVVKGFWQRALTALSPRCRRTKVFTDWRNKHFPPRVGWRFADGESYQSKEPMNVPNVPSSHTLRAAISCV